MNILQRQFDISSVARMDDGIFKIHSIQIKLRFYLVIKLDFKHSKFLNFQNEIS